MLKSGKALNLNANSPEVDLQIQYKPNPKSQMGGKR